MAVKVQQNKLPEFWGQKDKDSITANEFVKRVDKMMSANNWSDKIAFDNFGLALRGSANTWLDSQVTLKKIVGDREHWTIICPFFKEEFATESDDKLFLDGLAHMSMRPTENIRDFFGQLNKVNTIILDAYQGYTLAPQDPVPDTNGNVTMTHADHQAQEGHQLQPMHTLDLDTAVCLATIELCSKDEARGTSRIQAVQQEEEEDNV